MRERIYYVYILASRSRNLYVGVTNDVVRRVAEHRSGSASFTGSYRIGRLVHVESTGDIRAAIAREKQLKQMSRARKLRLISEANPSWDDRMPELGSGSHD